MRNATHRPKHATLVALLALALARSSQRGAFQGGIATALLGVFFHFLISFVVAAVFFLGAERIPMVRRSPIIASLLYGFGVFIVMTMVVVPLSATPALPPPTAAEIIIQILAHILISGLPLGILVRRNARAKA